MWRLQKAPLQREIQSANRIGYSQEAAWRYDSCGNRVEQLHSGIATANTGNTANTEPGHRTQIRILPI